VRIADRLYLYLYNTSSYSIVIVVDVNALVIMGDEEAEAVLLSSFIATGTELEFICYKVEVVGESPVPIGDRLSKESFATLPALQ
jgi:hypothetical protein